MILQFGNFISVKLKGQGFFLKDMADELDISSAY